MFRNLTSSLTQPNAKAADAAKTMSPSLRTDIYNSIDQGKAWLIGGLGSGQAGDGVSFGPLMTTIQKYLPETKMGLESMAQAENETAIVVGGITNMILTMSKWDGMASGMAMRTWVEALAEAYAREPGVVPGRKNAVANGIARGINQNTDATLMTREFAARVQMISTLKTGTFSVFLFIVLFVVVPNTRTDVSSVFFFFLFLSHSERQDIRGWQQGGEAG
jgi:hypothetical protein